MDMKAIKLLAVLLALLMPQTPKDFLVNGEAVGTDPTAPVYAASDIIYYESGKDFKYGEGTEKDAHTAQEAAAHTVVHITKPGTYRLSGTLSKGQVAVDLGEDAKKLHKYDGAFYSKMSMNVGGEGSLYIRAENEGLDSELHLTINSGISRYQVKLEDSTSFV